MTVEAVGASSITAADVFRRAPAPMPAAASRPVLDVALGLLPALEDDLAIDLVEQLAYALVDRDEELRAVRAVLSEALGLTYAQHTEILRLRRRLGAVLDAQRARPAEAAA